MIYLPKFGIFAILRQEVHLPEGDAYEVTMPSGLNRLVWKNDGILI